MTTGWVIPLAATVRLEIADGGQTVRSGWDFDRTMVSNHPNGVFEIAAGVVDTDSYSSLIHFPFLPLDQAIPFQRSAMQLPGGVQAETLAEAQSRVRIQRATSASDGWYRKEARDKR